ncbi:uncharacterized protein F5891DRAFT_898335, partial [Suillus fuscotomentosus]
HSSPLTLICMHPDAKKKTNGLAPVTSEVINTILNDPPYWRLKQIVMTVKFIANAVGNLELRQASLADCMLELLHCAKQMSQLACKQDYHVGFWLHARSVFNHRFHTMNTEVHSLALFLHPMCRKLAVTQVAKGRSLTFMVKIALGIAKCWKWDIMMAKKLSDDLQAYNQSVASFADGQADGLSWWQNLPINSEIHPLKAFAVTILSIVGHADEVERTFSDLSTTQSARQCNLSVETFETFGKICANLRHHSVIKATEAGKSTRHRHAHMHTHEEVGIAVETTQDLEA